MQTWRLIAIAVDPEPVSGESVRRLLGLALDRAQEGKDLLAAIVAFDSVAALRIVVELQRRSVPCFVRLSRPFSELEQGLTPDEAVQLRRALDEALRVDFAPSVTDLSEARLDPVLDPVEEADALIAICADRNRQPTTVSMALRYARELGMPTRQIDLAADKVSDWEPPPKVGLFDPDKAGALPASPGTIAPRDVVEKAHRRLDAEANRLAPATRLIVLQLILIHLFASAVTAVVSAFEMARAVQYASILLKLAALLIALLIGRHQFRVLRKRSDARVGAELCRSWLGLWPVRRLREAEPGFVPHGQTELSRSLRMLWYQAKGDACDLEQARQRYLEDRLAGQRTYYSSASSFAGWWNPRLAAAATVSTILAVVSTLAWIGLAWPAGEEGVAVRWLKMLSALLPLLSAAILTWIVARELPRRAVRYAAMDRELERLERRIRVAPTWPALCRAVSHTESLLLQELSEWHARYGSGEKDR